ncbi:PREDICTED: coiled-coil domain-containing protein 144B-like, partial [Galeopterus variegatus]|uniref:Coiled-coil domain-containing protein 144B-like n=1 Tax=Galeopterus variegatus TaxID=482537 RepID=A0ABM0SAZ5_GALVR
NCQLISKYTEEQRLKDSSPNRNPESLEKYPHLKPTVEKKVSVPNKAVGEEYVQTSRSDWSSTSLTPSNETCPKSENWKVDDKYPLVSQSVTQNQPASTELGQMTSRGKENINVRTVFLLGNYALHDLCESQLPENKESKEGLSAELDFRMTAEKEREWPDGNENKQPR